jgi:hypothetical protein
MHWIVEPQVIKTISGSAINKSIKAKEKREEERNMKRPQKERGSKKEIIAIVIASILVVCGCMCD